MAHGTIKQASVYDISEVFLLRAPSGAYIDKYSDHVDCPDEFV